MQHIHILLPVHNRRKITERFVRCLERQTVRGFTLILIDDGSIDGTSDMVRSILPDTIVLRGDGRLWWAGSLQRGLDCLRRSRVADDDLVLFINDDVTVAPDYLERALRVMANRRGSFVLSRFKSPGHNAPRETGTHADLENLLFKVTKNSDDINCLSTQGLFAHWGDVRAVGDFHPRLLPHYLSDYEYTLRAHRMGFKCETSAELVIDLDPETTGFHQIDERRFTLFLRKFFSLKSPGNPIYFSTFVWLACPRSRLLPCLIRVWRHAMRTVMQAFLVSVRS